MGAKQLSKSMKNRPWGGQGSIVTAPRSILGRVEKSMFFAIAPVAEKNRKNGYRSGRKAPNRPRGIGGPEVLGARVPGAAPRATIKL